MMGRKKDVWNVQSEFSDDFTVVNNSLLLCKFCDSVVNWKKKTRIYEHLQTKMHSEKKEAKILLNGGINQDFEVFLSLKNMNVCVLLALFCVCLFRTQM